MSTKAALKQIIELEKEKCKADPIYFMMKYVYIQTNSGRQMFNLYVFQKKLLSLLYKNDRLLILKSRQLGITTLCAGYILWLMLFTDDQSILAVAPDQKKANNILEKVVFAYENLPSWMRKMCTEVENNKTTFSLSNGSKMRALSGSSKAARGYSANILVIDEAHFIDDAEEIWGSAQQTLATGNGRAIVLSTPNGAEGWFYDEYEKAEVGDNNFIPVKLPWDVHPDRDQAWRDAQDKELGKRLAAQECDCSFLSSGNTFFESEDIEHISTQVLDPIEVRGHMKDFWIWKYPNEVKRAAVIVDTARGDGADKSCVEVVDLESMEQVAQLISDSMSPKELAGFAVRTAMEYNNAILIVENTGIGETTVSYVKDSNYENIYKSPKGDADNPDKIMDAYFNNKEDMFVDGFTNSTQSRINALNAMWQMVADKVWKIRSKRTLNQMRSFVWKKGKPQAKAGANDDSIIPLAIISYLRDTALMFAQKSNDSLKNALKFMQKVDHSKVNNSAFHNNGMKQYQMKNIHGGYEDISWLLNK